MTTQADHPSQQSPATTPGTTSDSAGSSCPIEAAAEADPASRGPDNCPHCGAPFQAHQHADDCEQATLEAEANPHRLTRGQLRQYPQPLWPLVLAHGQEEFTLAWLIASSNAAVNQWLKVAHNLRHLRQPTELIIRNLDTLFKAHAAARGLKLEELFPLVQAIAAKAAVEAKPRIIVPGSSDSGN